MWSELGHHAGYLYQAGVPTAPAKCEGLTTSLDFLGFELDNDALVARLPQPKLQRTQRLVEEWLQRRACKKRELESLLSHLATVVRPGRTFVRRLIELLAGFQSRKHCVWLNSSVRSDLRWWSCFLADWKGASLMPRVGPDQTPLVSDTSGSWGSVLGYPLVSVEMEGGWMIARSCYRLSSASGLRSVYATMQQRLQ
jgi:hypothetical protein